MRRTHEEDTRKRTHGREHTEENTRVEDSGAIAGGVMEALMIQRIIFVMEALMIQQIILKIRSRSTSRFITFLKSVDQDQ